jgi:hypothetical protein
LSLRGFGVVSAWPGVGRKTEHAIGKAQSTWKRETDQVAKTAVVPQQTTGE